MLAWRSGQIPLLDGEEHEAPEPRIVEDLLHDHHAPKHPAEVEGDHRHRGEEAVPERVPEEHAATRQALEDRRPHVGRLQHLDHAAARGAGDVGEGLDSEGGHGQGQHLEPERRSLPVDERARGGEPAEPSREDEDEQGAEDEGGDGDPAEREHGDRVVGEAVPARGRQHPQQQRDRHRQDEGGDGEAQRVAEALGEQWADGRRRGRGSCRNRRGGRPPPTRRIADARAGRGRGGAAWRRVSGPSARPTPRAPARRRRRAGAGECPRSGARSRRA